MATDDPKITRIADRLLSEPEIVSDLSALRADWTPPKPYDEPPLQAAVLIALVLDEGSYGVLYTERSSSLRSHSGQIAFPGGKVDSNDFNIAAAALREASEEVAMVPSDAEIIGYMPPYLSGLNYLITPVVAVVRPSAPFLPNPREVQSVFQVPLPVIASAESYGTYRLKRGPIEHTTWQIDYQGHTIWGITANLTRRFRDLALAGDDW